MNDLISGKEAKAVWGRGEDVLYRSRGDVWRNLNDTDFYSSVFNNNNKYEFKLKPRTITINGIEVVKPQENMPKKGDDVFTLDFRRYEGYVSWTCQSSINTFSHDWWRSEDEIKQVVEALRQVFGIRQILTEDKIV